MKKLDELLKSDWTITINIGVGGLYYASGSHWQHSPITKWGYSITEAINELYKAIWDVTK